MRVLFVTNMWPDDERPWYGSFVHSQARSLSAIGIEVDVLAIRGYVSGWEYGRSAVDMVRRSATGAHDVVHAHYGHSAVVGRLDIRHPLVISYCGDDLLGTPTPGRPEVMSPASLRLAGTFAQVARVADATITKSRQMGAKLPARVQIRNHVIPNGVDLEMFTRVDQASARTQLGWNADERIALFVGNPAIERKNYALAEQACDQAAQRCPQLRLRVANGIAPQQMPVWMSGADVLIHPSWSEGSPNAVKEAMACELPVVATPAGDVPERLHGVAGCHVLKPDVRHFADALLDAIDHRPCGAAREAVLDLSLERVARRIADIYKTAVARHGGSS